MTVQGKVAIPANLRREKRLKPGDDFEVLTTVSGDIVLRRVKVPARRLREHLRGLAGLADTTTDAKLPAPIAL